MAGPKDWGAVLDEEKPSSPTDWGAVPDEQQPQQGGPTFNERFASEQEPLNMKGFKQRLSDLWERGKVDPETAMASSPELRMGVAAQDAGKRFVEGFKTGFGEDEIGLSEDQIKQIKDLGLGPGGSAAYAYFAQQFKYGAVLFRGLNAVAQGVIRATLGEGELSALPDAFMGSPHFAGIPKPGEAPASIARVVTDRNGTPRVQHVGDLPTQGDFKAGADVLSRPEPRLVVARRMPDGQVHYGNLGGLHSDLLSDGEYQTGAVENQMGFAVPGGPFLTREQALDHVAKNEPSVKAELDQDVTGRPPVRLEALHYKEAFDAARQQSRSAPTLVEKNLRELWDERGIHPAEVVHDAQNDALLRHDVAPPSIEAFHGSPNDFEAFDLGHAGKNQGASEGAGINVGNADEARGYGPNIYKVIIHADPEKMIDLYEGADKQPQTFLDVLKQHGIEPGPEWDGRQMLQALEDKLGDGKFADQKAAAEVLKNAGVPGVKVDPSVQKYVVFDDKLLEITEKNGVPLKPTKTVPVQNTPMPQGTPRSELARTGEPHIDAILDDPVTKRNIDEPVINDQYDVPYSAGGSVPLHDPTMYIDRHFPRSMEVDGVRFDPAEPFTIHENIEQHVMEALVKGGMDKQTAYKVAHFEFAEKAEGAWYRAHGIDQAKAEEAYRPYIDQIQHENPANPPPNLYVDPYPHDDVNAAKGEPLAEPGPTKAEIARAKEILAQEGQPRPQAAPAQPAIPTSTFIKDIGTGKSVVPTVADLTDALKLVRDQDRASARAVGMTDKEYNRLVQLNRDIDKGSTTGDLAIKEKNELLKRFPDEWPEVDMIDEDRLKTLRTEFENLEKSDFESVQEYSDGIARTLKRYISGLTDGDEMSLAVFRKAFDEAQKHGLDTKALSNDIINRFLSDLSGSDQAYMRKVFQDFLRPKLAEPGEVRPKSLGAGAPLNEKNSFAFRVLTAADEVRTPIGKSADQFHPDKVAISDLYQEYANRYGAKNKDPLTQGEFKQKLLEAAQRGEVELARLDMPEMLDRPRALNSAIKWGDSEVHFLVKKRPSSLGAAATGMPPDMPDTPLSVEPASPPGTVAAAGSGLLDQLNGFAKNVQYMLDPMATGSNRAMVIAKDAISMVRRIRWDHLRYDRDLVRNFTPEVRKDMWDRADEESVARQLGESTEHMGLTTLEPNERAMVEELQARSQSAWLLARDAGIVEGDGLPAYTPRMVLNVAGAIEGLGPRALNELGRNVFTRTAQLKRRGHMTAEETEAAAKELVGKRMAERGASMAEITAAQEKVAIARDIRALALATARLEEASVWRTMINEIEMAGKSTGGETVAVGFKPGNDWFTVAGHPAFTRWEPMLEKLQDVAGEPYWQPIRNDAGEVVFQAKPIYMHNEFKGPMTAILDRGDSQSKVVQGAQSLYGGLMALKGKSMTAILNSPLIHSEVVWSKVMEAAGGREWLGFNLYFRGNRIVGNPGRAGELVERGLQPMGPRGAFQDITSMMENPDITKTHHESWTGKILGFVPGLFDEAAGAKVEAAIAKAGDFYHNTLLWDRVRDVQFGLADYLSDQLIAKGHDRLTADRISAHFSNIVVGSIPKESMSGAAAATANMLLFSRSFTLGNLATYKQAVMGLPKPILAQIERDFAIRVPEGTAPEDTAAALAGVKKDAQSIARRKAAGTIALSAALFYAGNTVFQHAFNLVSRDATIDEETKAYARRFAELMADTSENPFELRHLVGRLSPTYDNEPKKSDRVHIGYDKDGTAIYARLPTGKYGEEVVGYPTMPMEMMRRKLSPMAGGLLDVLTNDKGFGRKVYDENDTKDIGGMGAVFAAAKHMVMKHLPEQQITAASDLLRGEGDPTVNKYRLFGPVFGFTASVGAPGGQARGEVFNARNQFDARFNIAWPDIRKQVLRGDSDGAREALNALGVPPRMQEGLIRNALNPSGALRGSTLRNFYQSATPEQVRRFERAQQRDQGQRGAAPVPPKMPQIEAPQ